MNSKLVTLYLLTIALVFFNFNPDWGYLQGSPWWTHISFHFAHANVFHLAANLLVAFCLLRFQRNPDWWLFPVSFCIATFASFCIIPTTPTVGLSGVLFAYYGIVFTKDGPKLRPLLQTMAYMVVSCLFTSRMAIGLHCISLFVGAVVGGFIDIRHSVSEKLNLYKDNSNELNPS